MSAVERRPVGEHGCFAAGREFDQVKSECGEIDENDYRADFGLCNRCNHRFRLGKKCPKCGNPEFRLIPKKRAAAKIAARKATAMKSNYGHRQRPKR